MSCQYSSNLSQSILLLIFKLVRMTTDKIHSTDPLDYQDLPQAIGVMTKSFGDGWVIPRHEHTRDQLLYAPKGIMRLQTGSRAWIVPPDSAVYIPAGTPHAISMHGDVEMRTLYIDTRAAGINSRTMRVIAISGLLRELILALSEEPLVYEAGSRADLIAQMIKLEIEVSRELPLNIPLPHDARLQRLCAALLANPADRRTLDAWSEIAGASPRTLARLFERDLGMSFIQWRQLIRFHNALEALSRKEPISQVARQNGYHSASAFAAAFGKVMGLPPSTVAAKP